MKAPFVRRKRHEAELQAAADQVRQVVSDLAESRAEAAQWQVEYRKIRGRIVDIATHPGATPQIRATLAEFAGFRP